MQGREFSVADHVLSTPPPKELDAPRWPFSWDFRGGAKLFTLDNPTSRYLHDFAVNNISWLMEHIDFAILPYSRMVLQADEDAGLWTVCAIRDRFADWNLSAFTYSEHDNNINCVATGAPSEHLPSDAHRTANALLWARMLAFVLLLNGRRVHTISETPAAKTFRRGKTVRYMANSVVRIDITSARQLRRAFGTGTHATPRRHEVMGHFVHRGGQRGCVHEWSCVHRDDEIPRWECAACGRKRTWRKAFERGDAGKGFVRQTYNITRGQDNGLPAQHHLP